MEPVQIVLLLVIVILTIVLSSLGIQVFFILREIKRSVEKTNKILDDAGVITESIAAPVSTVSTLVMNIKTGVTFVNWLKKTYSLLAEHSPFKGDKDKTDLTKERRENEVGDKGENHSFSSGSNDELSLHSDGGLKNGSSSPDEDKKPLIRRFFRGVSRKRII